MPATNGDAAMITLYAFGPAFGLPDPSPFVVKTMVLLHMAGLPYRTDTKGLGKAPKGKLAYIRDGEDVVANSTFIRLQLLERRYSVDFDEGLTPAERGVAWAVEKLLEDHAYWLMMHARWMDDENFARGPAKFFEAAAAQSGEFLSGDDPATNTHALQHRDGRYTEAERVALAGRALASVSAIFGDKPYLMGERPCGADATLFAFAWGALCPVFDTEIRAKAEAHANLKHYCERLRRQYFPDEI